MHPDQIKKCSNLLAARSRLIQQLTELENPPPRATVELYWQIDKDKRNPIYLPADAIKEVATNFIRAELQHIMQECQKEGVVFPSPRDNKPRLMT